MKRKYNVIRKGRVLAKVKLTPLTNSIVHSIVNSGYTLTGNYKRV